MYKYQSPLEMSRQYLLSKWGNFLPEELQAIERAKSIGANEDVYIPAVALNRMKKEDTELGRQYDDYKKSPTTFMSNFKSQYGEWDKWIVGKVLWFVQNAIVDVAETGEELGKAALNPIDTAKGLLSMGKALDIRESNKEAKEMRSALWKTVTDNFGTVEKMKETFYENPFDVLSILVPPVAAAWKVAGVGKLAWTISKAANVVSEWGKLGKVAWGAAKAGLLWAEKTINWLKTYANIDNYIMGKMMKAPWAMISWGQDALGTIVYWNKWGRIMKSTAESTQDTARIAEQTKYGNMTPEQIGKLPDEMIWKVKEWEQVAMKEAWSEVASEWPKQIVPNEAGAVFNKNAFEWFTFWPSKGDWLLSIKYADDAAEVSQDITSVEKKINQAFKESKLTKEWLLQPVNAKQLEIFRSKLDEIASSSDWVPKRMVDVLAGEIRGIQNRTFPKIEKVRKEFSDAYTKIGTLQSEIGKATKDSTIYKRMSTLINDTGLDKETIDFFATKTGVNLEDVAVALSNKDIMGRMGKTPFFTGIIGWGAASFFTWNPAWLISTIWTVALTSPALLYNIAKFTWPKKAAIIRGIADATGATTEAVTGMMDKISKAADASKYTKTVSAARTVGKYAGKTGKAANRPAWYALMQRIYERIKNSDEAAGVSEQREDLQGQMQSIGEMQVQGMQQPQEQQPSQPTQNYGDSGLKYKWEAFNL